MDIFWKKSAEQPKEPEKPMLEPIIKKVGKYRFELSRNRLELEVYIKTTDIEGQEYYSRHYACSTTRNETVFRMLLNLIFGVHSGKYI